MGRGGRQFAATRETSRVGTVAWVEHSTEAAAATLNGPKKKSGSGRRRGKGAEKDSVIAKEEKK